MPKMSPRKGASAVPERAEKVLEAGMAAKGVGRQKYIDNVLKLDVRTVRKIVRGEQVDYLTLTTFIKNHNTAVDPASRVTYEYLTGKESLPSFVGATLEFDVREQGERDDPLASARVTIDHEGATLSQGQTDTFGRCTLMVKDTIVGYRVEKDGFESATGTLKLSGHASITLRLPRISRTDAHTVRTAVQKLLTRFLHGMRYFALYQRGSATPLMSIDNPSVQPNDLWPSVSRVLQHADALKRATTATSPAVVAVTEDCRVFVIPLEGFVFVGVFEEKIGDVLWHTYWERTSAEMSLAQVIRPLADLSFSPADAGPEAAVAHLPVYKVRAATAPLSDQLNANGTCLITLDSKSCRATVAGEPSVQPVEVSHYAMLVTAAADLCTILHSGEIIEQAGYHELVVAGMDVAEPVSVLCLSGPHKIVAIRTRMALGAAVAITRAKVHARAEFPPPPFLRCRGLQRLRAVLRSLSVLQVCYLPEKLVWITAHLMKSSEDFVVPDIFGALWDDVRAAVNGIRPTIGEAHTLLLELPSEGPLSFLSHKLDDNLAIVVGGAEGCEAVFSAFERARSTILTELSIVSPGATLADVSFDPTDGEVDAHLKLTSGCNPQCAPMEISELTQSLLPAESVLSKQDYKALRPLLMKLADRANIICRWLARDGFHKPSRLTVIGSAGLLGILVRREGNAFRLTIGAALGQKVGTFSHWLEE